MVMMVTMIMNNDSYSQVVGSQENWKQKQEQKREA